MAKVVVAFASRRIAALFGGSGLQDIHFDGSCGCTLQCLKKILCARRDANVTLSPKSFLSQATS